MSRSSRRLGREARAPRSSGVRRRCCQPVRSARTLAGKSSARRGPRCLEPRGGEPCPPCRVSCPGTGCPTPHLPEQPGATPGRRRYVPAARCPPTGNAWQPEAGGCNPSRAPLTRAKTREEHGPAGPGLSAGLRWIAAPCRSVAAPQGEPLSPCSVGLRGLC